jgi:uncharacterized protein YxjI
MKPRLYIDQKITAFVNKYSVYNANEAGEKASLIALAQQKRLAFKEKVTFYSDEQKSQEIFGFRAEKVLDVHGSYFVEATEGTRVGSFRKVFTKSLISSTWIVMDAQGNDVYKVEESNMTLAILRRFAGWIPIVGDIFELILLFFRYHFVFVDIATGQTVGKYQKVTLFRDHYALHLTDEAFARLDWRVYASMGVGLDALQSR